MGALDIISSVLAVLAAVTASLIGITVWFGERKNNLRSVFLWLTVFVSVWIISNVVYAYIDESYRFAVALISYTAAMFVATTTLFFVLKLVRVRLGFLIFVLLGLGYLVGIISAIPGVVGVGVQGISINTSTVGIITYALIIAGFLLGACAVLLRNRNMTNRALKRQVNIVLNGVVVASAIGLLFNLVLPMIGFYQFTQLGPAGATIFVVYIAYAVARYSLFDIRLAILRAIAYGVSFATLAAVYAVFAFLVATIFNRSFLSTNQLIFNSFMIVLMAALLRPVKHFFDRVTGKVFFKNSYDVDQFYKQLSSVLASNNELKPLLTKTSSLIASSLKSEQVFFFIFTQNGYKTGGTPNHCKLSKVEADSIGEAITLNYQSPASNLLIETRLETGNDIRRLMVSHKLSIILPLQKDGEFIGCLGVGHRLSGDYSTRDFNVLATIADELVIAIQNAQSLQEVKELNSSLEQRISNATKELRASNRQLQRLDEAKDEFISMASHQLRTPLTSIKGYLSMLIDGDVGSVSKEQKQMLSEAFVSSERMVRLIGDFLNVSRLQTGKFVIDKRPIDLAELVGREIESLESNAEARGIKFVYKKPKNIPILQLDENKIEQVIMNFADNAIYYSKDNGKVVVELKRVDEFVEFTVKDNGIGVPKADQARLFTKFFRAGNARQARPDGTGVGLFLARKVITDHGGSLIFSSIEGKGSTFGFRLPL